MGHPKPAESRLSPPAQSSAPSLPRTLFLDHAAVLGGAEYSLTDLARTPGLDCEVTLLARGPFVEHLEKAGVPVSIIEAPTYFNKLSRAGGLLSAAAALPALAGLAFRVARAARGWDVLYANSQKSFFVAALAGAIARKPVVWHLRDILSPGHFSRIRRLAATFMANRFCSAVIVNSNATRDAFIAAGGRATLARVVYNGIDVDRVGALDTRAETRAQLGIPAGTPLVGCFGRICPWKGQHVLIEAMKDIPSAHAIVVGAPIFGEVDYERELRDKARELGVEARVHFLGFRDDVGALMSACDAIAHTSVEPEPFGRVLVEGMLSGKTVIATRIGGPLEILEDGESGLLVPPGDSRALAAALSGLIADPLRNARIAKNGKARALSKFSVKSMRENAMAVVTKAVGRRVID